MSHFKAFGMIKWAQSNVLDYALQVESYYSTYYVLCSCSIKALEFCHRGPYYVTACQLFDFSDQLQFDAQLNKLFVQNFHCNSFFLFLDLTRYDKYLLALDAKQIWIKYVWLDKKGDKNCTWRHFIWGKKWICTTLKIRNGQILFVSNSNWCCQLQWGDDF